MFDYPLLVLPFSLLLLYAAEWLGAIAQRNRGKAEGQDRDDYTLIVSATLTLLGLIIGFTFSMSISRYDQRKNYEEEEANAIGTEYLRLGLLPAGDAAKARELLRTYLNQRLLFYEARSDSQLRQIDSATTRLENDLWSVVQDAAVKQPSPIVPLAVSGMNDVLNTQGYTQAAWWNRIPLAAWSLMGAIAIFSNVLIGYGMHSPTRKKPLLLVLPLAVAISFMLIADIDSPRGGVIRVHPQNLTSLSQSLNAH